MTVVHVLDYDPRTGENDEGDIVPMCDYREPDDFLTEAEIVRAQAETELLAIAYYESSREYANWAKQGHTNLDTRRNGGVNHCDAMAKEQLRLARETYLSMQGLPIDKRPPEPTSEQNDQYDKAVAAWASFRTGVLEAPVKRETRIRELLDQAMN